MSTKIAMGNDEFILYIRKKKEKCDITNDQLGKMIWVWLRDKDATKIEEDKVCLWGKNANANEQNLPKTAAQFEFDRKLLPELYDFLDELIVQ